MLSSNEIRLLQLMDIEVWQSRIEAIAPESLAVFAEQNLKPSQLQGLNDLVIALGLKRWQWANQAQCQAHSEWVLDLSTQQLHRGAISLACPLFFYPLSSAIKRQFWQSLCPQI